MRIISNSRLKAFWKKHPAAEREVTLSHDIVENASWKTPPDVKQSFGVRVDFVRVKSKRTIAVVDVTNIRYRIIAALHYDRSRAIVLRILRRAEYELERWKDEL